MSLPLLIIICAVLGYLIGTISTGYIVGKIYKLDIRDYGSGNAGTTNAFRVIGKKGGIITFIGDFLKSFIPLMVMKYWIFKDHPAMYLLLLVFGIACVLGHNYPVWLKFKGGKGIASTGGVFGAVDHWLFLPGALIFGGLIFITKYVSVGSLCVSLLFPIWIAITKTGDPYYIWLVILSCLFTVSAFFRHRANIVRLLNGTENKVGQHVAVCPPTAGDSDADHKEQKLEE